MTQKLKALTMLVLATALVAGCNNAPADPAKSAAEAEEFAARINGGKAQPVTPTSPAPVAPTVAEPLPAAVPGEFAPGTATDPAAEICGATRIGPFLGRKADDITRERILDVTADVIEVRFIDAAATQLQPDPSSPRLNILLDAQGIIRSAACG